MTPEELEDRMSRILKTCANIKQALGFIENEADLVITQVRNANQPTLFEDENPVVTLDP